MSRITVGVPWLAVAGALLIGVPAAEAGGPPVSRLVIFGDSLSDVGNVDILTFGFVPGAPYFNGRFSNGPLWVEALSAELGLPAPTESGAGGTNYAHGGATSSGGFSNFIIPNVGRQVTDYLSSGPAAAPGDLFVLFAGGNDIIDGQTNENTIVSNLTGYITMLANAGAQRFLVLDLPPLGQTPRALGTANEIPWDDESVAFNAAYAGALTPLASSLGVTIDRFDTFEYLNAITAAPETLGLTNTTEPAYDENAGTVAPNATEYLYWDDIHPTSTPHSELGRRVASRLACPADANSDGTTGFDDLLAVLSNYGRIGFAPAGDIDGNGIVEFDDLLAVLSAWGDC